MKNTIFYLSISVFIFLTNCSSSIIKDITVEPFIQVKPFNGPVSFTITKDGITVSASVPVVVSPLGTVKIGASFSTGEAKENDLVLVLRNYQTGEDTAYIIENGRTARIEVDGYTVIEISHQQIIIDITNAIKVTVSENENMALLQETISLVANQSNYCPGAFETRLSIGDEANIVIYQLNVRSGPSTDYPQVEHQFLNRGRSVQIVDGPTCDENGEGLLWWYVKSEEITFSSGKKDVIEGWVAEESGDVWLLAPK